MRLHSKLITPVNILSIFSSKCHVNNIVTRPLTRFYHQNVSQIGIADNHGITKIMETVIFVNCHDAFAHFSNCHECCGFAKMPYFCHVFLPKYRRFTFSQEYFVFNQHNVKFNTKLFTFPLPLIPKSMCFVTYWRNMWPWRHRSMYTVFQKKFTLFVFTITKSDVDQFQ